MLLTDIEDVNAEIVGYLADKVITDLRNKWELYRGLIDTPCNLVCLRGERYLFLSTTSLDPKDHEVILGVLDWGLKSHYPLDKIELSVKDHMMQLAGL